MRRWILVTMMSVIISPALLADYATKKNLTGSYEDASVWSGTQPPTNGNPNQALTISTGSTITRNGDFNPVTVTINGKLIVKGNYTNNLWDGVTVAKDAVLEIFGDLNASANVTVMGGEEP